MRVPALRLLCVLFLMALFVHPTFAEGREKLRPEARALLAQADAKLAAEDHAGAIAAYIEAVKADDRAADLETLRRYARPVLLPSASSPTIPAEVTAAHIAALRQFVDIHPEDADAQRDLAMLLPVDEAEAFIAAMLQRQPNNAEIYRLRSQLRFGAGQYVNALADLERASQIEPQNAELFYAVGVIAYEIVKRPEFSNEQKRDLVRRGLNGFERAEALQPNYFEAMMYRSVLMREQAQLESDPAVQEKWVRDADALRQRAIEVMKARRSEAAPMTGTIAPPLPPPPPALPPASSSPMTKGPLRVGGDVKAPIVIERVDPVIPEAAKNAHIAGIVILEVLIDKEGRVTNARVLKPLPFGLNDAALNAVKQWKYRPGTLNGEAVDVIFNVTMNFMLE